MDILSSADVRSLIAQQGKWCVSLYMPTHRVGREQQQNPIRLKNLLAEAEVKLLANGIRRPEVKKLMEPAEQLLWDSNFWQHQGDGLAIFLSNDFFRVYRLPVEFEELLTIGSNIHIKPLLPLVGRGEKFYILAVSLNNVRLFEATLDSIQEITLNFPTSMDEIVKIEDPERTWNYHMGSMDTSSGRGSAGSFHGHGITDEEKTYVRRFLQTVNDGLHGLNADKNIPMVLAGVEYVLPIYRETSSYQNILADAIIGNPDRENVQELHEQALPIVRPLFEESQKKAYEKFEQLSGQNSDLATTELSTAIKAATFGQVETLFVPLGLQIWGRYDAENNKVIRGKESGAGNEDLLDYAATETILNSGQVFAVPREQMPGDGDLAVILRYALPAS
jgi:hypothetical protein